MMKRGPLTGTRRPSTSGSPRTSSPGAACMSPRSPAWPLTNATATAFNECLLTRRPKIVIVGPGRSASVTPPGWCIFDAAWKLLRTADPPHPVPLRDARIPASRGASWVTRSGSTFLTAQEPRPTRTWASFTRSAARSTSLPRRWAYGAIRVLRLLRLAPRRGPRQPLVVRREAGPRVHGGATRGARGGARKPSLDAGRVPAALAGGSLERARVLRASPGRGRARRSTVQAHDRRVSDARHQHRDRSRPRPSGPPRPRGSWPGDSPRASRRSRSAGHRGAAAHIVVSAEPLDGPGTARIYSVLLGESEVTMFATSDLAKACRKDFPKSLDGKPFLMPADGTPLRRSPDKCFARARSGPMSGATSTTAPSSRPSAGQRSQAARE